MSKNVLFCVLCVTITCSQFLCVSGGVCSAQQANKFDQKELVQEISRMRVELKELRHIASKLEHAVPKMRDEIQTLTDLVKDLRYQIKELRSESSKGDESLEKDSQKPVQKPILSLNANDRIVDRAIQDFLRLDQDRDNYLSRKETESDPFVDTPEIKDDQKFVWFDLVQSRGGEVPEFFKRPLPQFLNLVRNLHAQQTLADIDTNKNQFIDASELKRIRHPFSPFPETVIKRIENSDQNSDGKISLRELVLSYGGTLLKSLPESRSQHVQSLMTEFDANGNQLLEGDELVSLTWLLHDADGKVDGRRDGRISADELVVKFGGPRPSSPNKRVSSSRQAKIVSYAKSILRKYDKNNNEVLDKSEFTGVRSIPTAADQNKDSQITLEELISSFGGQ